MSILDKIFKKGGKPASYNNKKKLFTMHLADKEMGEFIRILLGHNNPNVKIKGTELTFKVEAETNAHQILDMLANAGILK